MILYKLYLCQFWLDKGPSTKDVRQNQSFRPLSLPTPQPPPITTTTHTHALVRYVRHYLNLGETSIFPHVSNISLTKIYMQFKGLCKSQGNKAIKFKSFNCCLSNFSSFGFFRKDSMLINGVSWIPFSANLLCPGNAAI